MKRSPLTAFLMALVLRAVLARGRASKPGRAPREGRQARRRRERAQRAAAETPTTPTRARPALAFLVVGAITMLVFESTITRVIGVLALFGFIVAGVFAIADPRWLGAAPELEPPEQVDASPARTSGYAAQAEEHRLDQRST